jgi:hypothetical protein
LGFAASFAEEQQKNYGKREMLTQWADIVAFLHEPFFITKGEIQQASVFMNQGRVLASIVPRIRSGQPLRNAGVIPIPPVNGWN